jgi:hypothetical protein
MVTKSMRFSSIASEYSLVQNYKNISCCAEEIIRNHIQYELAP